jgi:threonine synthase
MSHIKKLICVQCGAVYRENEAETCPRCGVDEGILEVQFDVESAGKTLTRQSLAGRERSHWRYRELLPLDLLPLPPGEGRGEGARNTGGLESSSNPAQRPPSPQPSPGGRGSKTLDTVGWTPIIEAPALAKELGIRRLRLKDDGRNPSGSFKDRPSSVGVMLALQLGAKAIACASTGNAASSCACSAASVGLPCYIFVAKFVPEGKLAQLLAFGATVFRVQGTYAQAYELCNQACAKFGWYNRNAAINPYLVEGKKTGGMELAEQLADDPPQWVSASVGDGCSIAGMYKGIAEMKAVGVTNWSAKMLGVQAAGCDPVLRAFNAGKLDRSFNGDTYADSINVAIPRNWRKAVNAVRESGGAFVAASDELIMKAVVQTGRNSGVFAEPAAATAVAGIAVARQQGILGPDADVVAMITGNGLKDVAGALRAVGQPHDVEPSMDAVSRAMKV